MRRFLSVCGLTAILCAPAFAHDFWLDPKTFHLDLPGTIEIRFLVGDAADIEPWVLRKQKVTSLRTYGPRGVIDQQMMIREGEAGGGAAVAFGDRGAHVLAMESIHAFIELPAEEFSAYVDHEGLSPIATDRQAPGANLKPGREIYSRRAKALIRVGEGNDDIFTRPIGMTLEIVPEKCPYHLARNQPLPVRVYFHGVALAGARVELASLDRPADKPLAAITDADGRARFSFEHLGRWRLAMVWSELLQDRARADYDTTFSSLTFGF